MRLRKRQRFDNIQNDIRARGRSLGRWIYFSLLGIFFFWIFDMFAGDLVYLRADGLVLRNRQVIATQHTSMICALDVSEGSIVKAGDVVAKICSQEVEQTLAQLASEIVQAASKITELSIRREVIDASHRAASQRLSQAKLTRSSTESLRDRQLISNQRYSRILEEELSSVQTLAQMEAEIKEINRSLPDLQRSLDSARNARERLAAMYADGALRAPSDGIVGYLHLSLGSVVRAGEPAIEIFSGKPYVLAYVPEGALFKIEANDAVRVKVGLKTFPAQVDRLFNVSRQYPREFQDTIRPPARARVVRIEFLEDQDLPTLFAKIRLAGTGWLPEAATEAWTEAARSLRPVGEKLAAQSTALVRMLTNGSTKAEPAGLNGQLH